MIAQLISQVSSHFIIHYHRRIVFEARQSYQQRHQLAHDYDACDGGEQKSIGQDPLDLSLNESEVSGASNSQSTALRQHQFSRPHRGETEKLVVPRLINNGLVFAVFSMVVLVILGCTIPSFSLEILGLIGVAVESGQGFEDATTHHSVFTVIKLLMEEARFLDTVGDFIGLGTLSALLVLSVLLVPILQSLALLRQWFLPSTRKEKARMSVLIEILQAWQYAEVYIIAIFVASWYVTRDLKAKFCFGYACSHQKITVNLGNLVLFQSLWSTRTVSL
jgi:hypothetical protein